MLLHFMTDVMMKIPLINEIINEIIKGCAPSFFIFQEKI